MLQRFHVPTTLTAAAVAPSGGTSFHIQYSAQFDYRWGSATDERDEALRASKKIDDECSRE
jgi:hypothetical protein